MNELVDLANLVSKNRIKHLNVIGKPYPTDSKTQILLNSVGKNGTKEIEIIEKIYGNSDSSSRYKFKKLQYRLFDKLLNTFLIIDPDNKKFYQIERAYHNCNKYYIVANVLMAFGAYYTAIKLYDKALKKAIKYELTELNYLLSYKLRNHFGSVEQNRRKFESFNEMFHKFRESFEAEAYMEELNGLLNTFYNQSRGVLDKKIYSELREIKRKVLGYEGKFDSLRFIRIFYKNLVVISSLEKKYMDVISYSDQAISLLHRKPFNLKQTIYTFNYTKLIQHLHLGQYEACVEICESYYPQFESNDISWFNIRYYYFILSMHTKNYQKAFHLLHEIKNNPNFNFISESLKENINVFSAFIHFLLKQEKIDLSEKRRRKIKEFRLGRFLNEVSHFSKDKRGLNISLLILHVLFLLQDRKYSKIIDRVDALNQYCYRYLRRDETFRSNCFIKMLTQMVKADFNRIRTERYVEPLWKKLKSVPLHVAEQGIEVEIIPYEDLWPMVLEMLG